MCVADEDGEKPIHTIAERRLIRETAMLLELDPGIARLLNRSGDSASYCVLLPLRPQLRLDMLQAI
jgi:hypothetical protein